MTDWYYHDPARGRVGPLTAEDMRQRYRERVIARDTLAWHEGLREWQPLERLIEELGLTGVQPDNRLPPPVPPRPAAATASHASTLRGAERPPSKSNGCLIVALVVGVACLLGVGLIAALAIPAYQDYVERSQASQGKATATFDAARMAETEALARELVQRAVAEHYPKSGACPDEYEFESLQVRESRLAGDENGWFGLTQARPSTGHCAYNVEFFGLGPELQGKTVHYEVTLDGENAVVTCRNNDLAPEHLPPACAG